MNDDEFFMWECVWESETCPRPALLSSLSLTLVSKEVGH